MRFTVLFFLLFAGLHHLTAAVAVATPAPIAQEITSADLSRDAVEAKLGRKLKFKERIALSIARGKMKRAERRGGTDGLAIASFVCGVLGLFLIFPAIPALVLGIISLGRYERGEYYTGKGLAIAGIVLGGLVTFTILLIVGIFALAFGAG